MLACSRSWASASAARRRTRASCSLRLKPFDQRKGAAHSAQAVIGRVDAEAARRSPARSSSSFSPPSIPGLSRFGGFEFQVLDQTGTDISTLSGGAYGVMGAAAKSPLAAGRLHAVHRERSAAGGQHRPAARARRGRAARRDHQRDADFPGLVVRERLPVQQPRLPRLRAGGPAVPRRARRTSSRSTRARATARWCRSSSVVTVKETTAPQVIGHFNLFRSATLNGSAAPGVSSGDALKEMERVATRDAAGGHGLRVVGHLAGGNQGGQPVGR